MPHATCTPTLSRPLLPVRGCWCDAREPPSFPRDAAEAARRQFSNLEAWLCAPDTLRLPLHEVERQQEPQSREMQRLLLQSHVDARGIGDVGRALRVMIDGRVTLYTHRRLHTRVLRTIVGPITIRRLSYGRVGADSLHPLDEALQLPARSFSYALQKRLIHAAVQGPFQEAIDRMAALTGVSVPKRSLEAVIVEAAEDVDAFYANRSPVPWTETATILVAAVDGKGIPMVKPGGATRVVRRTRGQKANRKRMATVAAVFTRAPWIRTPEDVVASLFRTGPMPREGGPPRPRPEQKRVWASLVKGKTAVISEVAAEMFRRDPLHQKTHVAVTDGERGLQRLVAKMLNVTLILDLLHVTEKLWKAAYIFHAEGSPEAEQWVRVRTLRILQGDVSQVVKGLRQMVTKRKLGGAKRTTVASVANYLFSNRARMQYDEYLAQGLPIASGTVEGACKNLIKDRMERSGMRWTESMAEAIVKLRAMYLSGDLDQYWALHIERDQRRLYHADRWTVVVK